MCASIKGLQKTSVVDFPPYVACTVFFSTCNFRCGFCHNPDLVSDAKELKEYSEQEILDFLESKKNILDGVCISGGEPTLYTNLKVFIKKIKEKGFKIKLDTNGTNPQLMKEFIDRNLIDYVAMDIKSSKERYEEAADVPVNIDAVNQSIDILKASNIDYEFRTTVVPGLVDEAAIKQIAAWLNGAKKYALQQFNNAKPLIDDDFEKLKPYDTFTLNKFKSILKPYFDKVEVRA